MNLDALSALGDTLPADVPKPESPKLRPEDIVSEGKVKEEKGVRVGERDDALPPEYRFKEEDPKKLPASKPEVRPGHIFFHLSIIIKTLIGGTLCSAGILLSTMDDKTALEMLSSDFSAAPKPAAPVTSSAATTKLETPALDSKPLKVVKKTKRTQTDHFYSLKRIFSIKMRHACCLTLTERSLTL
uniref:Calpastatin n=1 Tax=Amphilophus citrinellus TaxID=61819 RepID=A0A3Q0R3T6_AMPCI